MDSHDGDCWTLSVEQAARKLGVCRASAYKAAATGELPTIRFGRRILVPREALERALAARTEPGSLNSRKDRRRDDGPSKLRLIQPKRPRPSGSTPPSVP